MKRKYRREPRSIRDFFSTHGVMGEPADEKTIRIAENEGPELAENIRRIAGGNDGEGHLFLFPLTASAVHYEFFKGVLKIVAPKARSRTLVTPKRKSDLKSLFGAEKANLERHTGKVIGSNTTHLHFIDHIDTGTTLKNLRRAVKDASDESIRKLARKINTTSDYSKINDHLDELGLNKKNFAKTWWKKKADGSFAQYQGTVGPRDKLALQRRWVFALGVAYAKAHMEKIKNEPPKPVGKERVRLQRK